ncbi:MAG: hypothetical protein RKH07_15860 [Gammaproteobacteria bacterium]
MKIPESKQDMKTEITLPLGLCFGAALGIVFESIGIVYGTAGGLLIGVLAPTLFGSSSSAEKEPADGSDT